MKVYHIRTHYMCFEFFLFVVSFYFPKSENCRSHPLDLCLAMLLDCGLLILLFLVSFLCPIVRKIHTDNQSLAIYQQDYQE